MSTMNSVLQNVKVQYGITNQEPSMMAHNLEPPTVLVLGENVEMCPERREKE